MGAITFSLDAHIARIMRRELRCDTFFESGGFEGDTVANVASVFERVITVEFAPVYASALRTRFAGSKNVEIFEADSAKVLEKLTPELRTAAVLYWLDAHWCQASSVDSAAHQCPLLRELRALVRLNEQSAVIIDDARLFLAPPLAPHEVSHWPTWSQISKVIDDVSGTTHDVIVVNDCIVIYPRSITGAIVEYAQSHGVDWLKVADLAREHAVMQCAAEDRLKLINELHGAAEKASRVVDEQVHSLRRQIGEKEAELVAANQQASISHAEHRMSAKRLHSMQADLEAKEAAIQAMAADATDVHDRFRALGAAHEIAHANLRERESLFAERLNALQCEVETKAGTLDGMEIAVSQMEMRLRSLTTEHEIAKLELHRRHQVELSHKQHNLAQQSRLDEALATVTVLQQSVQEQSRALSERDGLAQALREQLAQSREAATARHCASAAQLAALEHSMHELQIYAAGLEAATAARANILAVAAGAFGTTEDQDASPLEPAARVLLTASARQWERHAVEKEAVIQELCNALAAHQAARDRRMLPIRAWHKVKSSFQSALKPKLGVLNQHPPVPLGDRTIVTRRPPPPEQLPTLCIVTPSFRQAHMIERTIASVVDQNYPKLQYFVQDGGSDDGTTAVLEKWAHRLTGWESKRDNGQSAAINLGFAKTSGDIMAWLNSDDLLMPGSLNCVAAYFHRHPEVDVVYGDRLLIDEDDALIGRWVLPGHSDTVLPWADFVPQETLFWRRSIWDRAGGQIDESFKFAMDWDLLLRFRKAGARFAHVPKYLGAFRIHASQKTSAAISDVGFKEMDRLRLREIGREITHDEIRRAIAPFMVSHIWADKLASLRKT
jgi:GT2 family glycosyltransferase